MSFYVLGGVVTGTTAIYVIPQYGWRMMYLIGGLAFIVVLLLAAFLRESPLWLVSHGRAQEAIVTINAMEKSAGRAATGWTKDNIVVQPPMKTSGVAALFAPEYRRQTIGLWVMYFMSCIMLYSIMAWMPTLLYAVKGLSLKLSYSFSLSQNVAASIACVVTGLVADKFGRRANIYIGYALIILIFPTMAFANGLWALFVTVFCVGFAVNFMINTAQPIIAEYYRPEIRNTGVSFATGFGRFGGFIGPLWIGVMKQNGYNFQAIIMSLIIPAFLGMLIVKFLVKEETKGKIHGYSNEEIARDSRQPDFSKELII
jgi:putative MFS transporter